MGAGQKDFFPLSVGIEKRYSYFMESISYKACCGLDVHDDYWKDSGTVVYKYLRSSVQNDTTIIWTIREILSIKSMGWHLDSLGVRDTIYSKTTDSIDYPLYEYTNGLHQLYANMTILKLYDGFNRFSDTTADTVVYTIADGQSYPVLNTFKKDDGLLHMFFKSSLYGNFSYYNHTKDVTLSNTITSVNSENLSVNSFHLSQNFPNPFNPTTTISYSLSLTSDIQLEIYSSLGQAVYKIEKKRQSVGQHSIVWDAYGLPSGVYFLRLLINGQLQSKKMILIK